MTVVGQEVVEALLGLRKSDVATDCGRKLLYHTGTLNISLRRGATEILYSKDPSIWLALSLALNPRLKNIYLWIDSCNPAHRHLYPMFRTAWKDIPEEVAERLTVSFPGEGRSWTWGGAHRQTHSPAEVIKLDSVTERLPSSFPPFKVSWRAWEAFTTNGSREIIQNTTKQPGELVNYNAFKHLPLYG
jgi:hypothetical protein